MSYAFIAENVADFPVQAMCAVLGVSRSGYYAWVSRPESPRDQADGALASAIRDAHEASRGRYGVSTRRGPPAAELNERS